MMDIREEFDKWCKEYFIAEFPITSSMFIAFKAGYALASKGEPVKFPTMLRKMWSGTEVQDWIDKNIYTSPPIDNKDAERMNFLSNGGWEVLRDHKYWEDGLNLREVIDRELQWVDEAIDKAMESK